MGEGEGEDELCDKGPSESNTVCERESGTQETSVLTFAFSLSALEMLVSYLYLCTYLVILASYSY